jgi:gliding motility-associated-like protein
VFDGPDITAPQIASANGAGNVPGGVPGSYWGNTIPGPFVSTHPSGCLTFRFRSDAGGTFAGWNANVVCGPPPTCAMPTNLQVVSTTSSTVTLGWTENNTPPATNWQIVQQAVGDGYPGVGATVIPVDTNPFTLPIPGTPVEYYVRTDCGGGDFSYWTGPLVFVAGDDWEVAVPICSFDDYTGTTLSSYGDESDWPNTWPELSTAFCGSIENDSFFVFEATGTTINMNVNVTCSSGTGVQFMIFDAATMGSGPVNEIGCYSPMNVGNNPLSFTGLTPGNTYYLMIDGYAGAVCDYTISLPDGSTTTSVNIIQDSQDLCIGQSIVLDAEGGNGNYTWSPAVGLDATTGNQVTFTPPTPGVYTISLTTTQTSIVCATSDDIVITVYDNTTPSFTNPGPLCAGSPNVPLDTTDANGILGTWTLVGAPVTEVDASTAGLYDYVFTPDPVAHPCSPVITMQVEIKAACTFGTNASAIYVDNCETTDPGEFFNITGSGTDLIGSPTYNYTSNDFGTYLQNSGNLILKGAELRSFKTTSSNVCQVNMYYRVYESSTAPGAFNVIALSLLDDCVAGTFPTGGTCDPDDQKWQNLAENIDLTQNAPGNYTIEVYYELIGDNDSPTACDGDIELLNNAGNNYLAEFTIQGTLTFSQSNEECASSNGSITISGFVPGDTYTVTYNDDTMPIAAVDYQADFNGDITIINLDAGTYDNFEFVINGCSIFDATQVVITNFSPSIAGITNNSPICFGNDATFTIEGSPNFDVDYTINGGAVQTVTLDASGFATVTVTMPAVGPVDLALLNIHNLVCNIVVTNTSSLVVNPLPTATISVPSGTACIGSDAVFTITGTPNATVTYSINGGANQTIVLDGTGNYTLNVPSTVDVQVTLIDVTDAVTSCVNTISGQVANVAIVDVPEATVDLTQPTCAVPLGTIEVTSPLISQVNYPGDLFISEITDAQPGSLTYVEIYNGTGVAVDLSAYKIRVTTNGTTLSCDLPLSGILVNDDVVVIKLSSSAAEGGVVADLSFTTCTGVNNNDRIALTNLANVDIDVWGTPDGTVFTPASGIGYNYQRITTGTTLPSNTWDPADWNATDWGNPTSTTGDYSNVGLYSLYALNYEYILDDGTTSTTQSTTTFSGVAAGSYTLVVHDTATNCYSDPITITIDPVVYNDPVTTISYVTPVCEDNANLLPDTSAAGFTSGGEYTATPVGLVIDIVTGEIDVVASTPGVYTINYSVLADAPSCLNAGNSTFEVTITAGAPATFNDITLCQGDLNTALPTTSLEGFTGTWDAANIDTSIVGSQVYTFTPDLGQCATIGTLDVEIISKEPVTFNSVEVCLGASVDFPTTSVEGYVLSGTWSPSSISTSTLGNVDYTFTPDDVCYDTAIFTVVSESCTIQKGISPNGDGLNDNFDLSGYNVRNVEIFNRYGRKVYSKSNYVNQWYGQSDSGNDLPTGTYYYVIEFTDSPSKTGWIYINREE